MLLVYKYIRHKTLNKIIIELKNGSFMTKIRRVFVFLFVSLYYSVKVCISVCEGVVMVSKCMYECVGIFYASFSEEFDVTNLPYEYM